MFRAILADCLAGPAALEILAFEADPADLKYYWFRPIAGVEAYSRAAGYTRRFILFSPAFFEHLWNTYLVAGNRRADSRPSGTQHAAPEAGFALYGHELDEETTLLEATWAGCETRNSHSYGLYVSVRQGHWNLEKARRI